MFRSDNIDNAIFDCTSRVPSIRPVIRPDTPEDDPAWEEFPLPDSNKVNNTEVKRHAGIRPRSKSLVLCGRNINDLPTRYVVEGIRDHEFPVIGTYVEKDIVPGFPYRVRCLGTDNYLFGGSPKLLQTIGMGYGKRLTFEGSSLNGNNTNYFYSDSSPSGYAFSVVAVRPGDRYVVVDDCRRPVGEATVDGVEHQQEIAPGDTDNGGVVKHLQVSFSCTVRYGGQPHGYMSLYADKSLCLTGVAVLDKPKGARRSSAPRIEQVQLPHFDSCVFEAVDNRQP